MQALFKVVVFAGLFVPQVTVEDEPSEPRFGEIDSRIWCAFEAADGGLWIGTDGGGLYRREGEELVHYTLDHGLPGMRVRSVQSDGRGGLLVSTTGGLGHFDGERFSSLAVEERSGSDGWRLDPSDVWLVTAPGEGPCRFDGERIYRLELPESPAEAEFRRIHPRATYDPSGVYHVFRDRRGHVWFGTATVGLCRYDGESWAWMYEQRLTETPQGGSFGIRSIYEDREGSFWICNTRQRFTFEREVDVRDGFTYLRYSKSEGLPASDSDSAENFFYFPSALEDADGALWLTNGYEGLRRYDGESVESFSIEDGPYAYGLQLGVDGEVWVSTFEHGMFALRGERLVPLR